MREILFRGKRIDNGEWIKGFYCQVADESDGGTRIKQTILVPTFLCQSGFKLREVNSETVGQYTGLTDKNNKKVFEWDIIKVPDCCHRGDAIGFVYYDCDETAYCAKCWGVKYQLGADLSSDSIEIIGNIHDNPELLEV